MKELSYHADFFLADQCKQRHNKNKNQLTCLDDFNKKLHTLLHHWKGMTKTIFLPGFRASTYFDLSSRLFNTVAPIWCPYLASPFKKISGKGFDSFLDQSISYIISWYMRGRWWLFKLRNFLYQGLTALRMTLCAAGGRSSVLIRVTS